MNNVDLLKSFMADKIRCLMCNPSESAVRASLARLRRGIGHNPGEIPEIWGEYLLELPEELAGRGKPSREEWAIYTSLTLFALHQQSNDLKSAPMHKQGPSLGAAARELIESEEDRERIVRRFNPVATASDMIDLARQLRGLVSLLRAKGIALDYVKLAVDIYCLQEPGEEDSVRLRWGEDFWKQIKENNTNQMEKGQ